MSDICSSSISTLRDLLLLLKRAHPADSFQWVNFITNEGYLILTACGRIPYQMNETTNTFEEMIDYTEDYIQRFGCSHPLKICDINYNRDNIYIDVTRSYINRLCHHIELYIDDQNDIQNKIRKFRNAKYDTLSKILSLLKETMKHDKYALIHSGISLPDEPIIDSKNRFYFESDTAYIKNIIEDVEFVLGGIDNDYFLNHIDIAFTKDSLFMIRNDLTGEKKNLLIDELCEIISEKINEDYAKRFEPELYVTLDELRDMLSNAYNGYCEYGFHNPHSYRENYDEVGFEPASDVSVAEMLSCVKRALGDSFSGYHGWDFSFGSSTRAHISNEGCGEIPQMMQKVIWSIRNSSD